MKFNKSSDSTALLLIHKGLIDHPLGYEFLEKIFQGIDWGTEILFHFLLRGGEPRIWTTEEPDGSTLWQVYDPQTHRSAVFETEAEVRVWLEERYYH